MTEGPATVVLALSTPVVLAALGWLIKGLRDNSMDQKKVFLQQGVWRSATDVRLAVLEEKMSSTASRVDRIPTTSQVYRRPTK